MSELYQESEYEKRRGTVRSNPGTKSVVAQTQAPLASRPATAEALDLIPRVLPVFSTLPANAERFSYGQTATVASANTTAVVFTQQVPAGLVFIADEFLVNINDTYNGAVLPANSLGVPADVFIYITLKSNLAASLVNQAIAVEPLDGYYPCHVIAGPGDILTITVQYDFSGLPTPPTNVVFTSHMNGVTMLRGEMPPKYAGLQSPVLRTKGV